MGGGGTATLSTVFNQVRLDPEIHTLVWPNDADFDPATLYHWNDGDGAELAERTRHWTSAIWPTSLT